MSTPPDSSYHLSFYSPWPLFGIKLSNQLDEIRDDTSALQGIVESTIFDKDPDHIKNSAFQGIEYGNRAKHNRFRTVYDDVTDEWKVQVNVGSEAFPVWDNSLSIDTSGRIDTFYFTGNIFVNDTATTSYRTDTIIFNRDDFYITSSSEGKPIINALAQASAGLPGSGTITGGINLGAGEGLVFKDASAADLRFRTLKQGSNVTISTGTNEVTISSTDTGEVNTASNVGSGDGQVFKTKSGVDLQFRRLAEGSNITITTGTDDVTIAAASTTATLQTAYDTGAGTITGVTTAKPVSIEGTSSGQRVLQTAGRIALSGSTSEFGTETKTVNSASRPHQVFIHGTDEFPLGIDDHSDSATRAGPGIRLYRSGGTSAAETVPPDDASLGVIAAYSHDGTDYGQSGRIRVLLKGEASNNSTPGTIEFATTSTGQSNYSGSTNSGIRGNINEDGWDIKGNARVRNNFYVIGESFIHETLIANNTLIVNGGQLFVNAHPTAVDDDATLIFNSRSTGQPQFEFKRGGISDWFFGSSNVGLSGNFFIFETNSGNTPIVIEKADTGKDTTTLVTDSSGAIGIGTFAATNPAFKVTLAGVSRSLSDFYVGKELFVADKARVAKSSRTTLRRENSGSSYTPDAHDRNVFALNLNQSEVAINNPINLPGTDETMTLTFMLKPLSSVSPVVSWGRRYLFPGNAPPIITTIGNRTDMINCVYDGGFYLLCGANQNYMTS